MEQVLSILSKELSKRGISVYKFSRQTGIPKERVYKWMEGKGNPKTDDSPITFNSYFDCDYILPLLYTSTEEVFEYLEYKGVPPNPLYGLGFGRVGCFPCIHSSKEELAVLPDWAWEKLEYWERMSGSMWFSPDKIPGTKGKCPTIREVKEWSKTVRGGQTI